MVILSILVFLTLVILIIIRFSGEKIEPVPVQSPTPTAVPTITLPRGETIEISQIPIRNPYISPAQINTEGDSLMTRDPGYDLVYLRETNQFIITIMLSPFETYRQIAEKALLERLNINEQEACSLDVNIGTPQSVNPNEAGRNYKLSFCE